MDNQHNTLIEQPLMHVINKMSIAFLELLEIEDEDGTMKPARYVIEDGKITSIFTED